MSDDGRVIDVIRVAEVAWKAEKGAWPSDQIESPDEAAARITMTLCYDLPEERRAAIREAIESAIVQWESDTEPFYNR